MPDGVRGEPLLRGIDYGLQCFFGVMQIIVKVALLVGIDRFMSECRAITNLIGNGVATVVIALWEGEVTAETLRENLRHRAA